MRTSSALTLAVLAMSCSEGPQSASQNQAGPLPALSVAGVTRTGEIPRFPELDSVGEVRVDPGIPDAAAELDDAALIEAVAKTDGRVIIGLKPPGARNTKEAGIVPAMSRSTVVATRELLRQLPITIVRTFRFSSDVVADIPPSLAPELRRLPYVNYVSPNYLLYPGQAPQDTTWGARKIGAKFAWLVTTGNYSTITMLDTGVDSVHVANFGLDGPQVLVNCLYVSPPATSCWQPTNYVHGSRVAGTMSARDNNTGFIGVAPTPYAFNSINVCSPAGCSVEAIIAGLQWAMGSGYARHIVNLSVNSCTGDTALASAIAAATNAGILVVSIAGNTDLQCSPTGVPGLTGVAFPGRYPEVIAVSGTMEADQFADPGMTPCPMGSRYGPEVDIAAPFWTIGMGPTGTWTTACGTSFAAPVVSAVAALIWSANTSWTAAMVRSRLLTTALDLGTTGFDNKFGNGRVRAAEALLGVLGSSISGPSMPSGGLQAWTASVTNAVAPTTYAWERRNFCDAVFSSTGQTTATYTEVTTVGSSFYLKVTVMSAGRTASAMKLVGGFQVC